jgi:CO/xanthine dehydrogenase FAD-binding subunit
MKPAPFDYHAPGSVPEVLDLIAEQGDDARVLAGGQSLVPMLNMRLIRPRVLISLRRLRELDFVRRQNGTVVVGSMTRQATLEASPDVREVCPVVVDALHFVGHPTIRNRGTLGGSIAHADPAAELPAVLVALDGRVVLASRRGSRSVAAADFFKGLMATDARPDELITDIQFPAVGAAQDRRGHGFEEVSRRHGDFAVAGVAVAVALDASTRVTDARIALLGVEARPRRCTRAEQELVGQPWRGERLAELAELAAGGLDPLSDHHASGEFRVHLAKVLTRRALAAAYERASGSGRR